MLSFIYQPLVYCYLLLGSFIPVKHPASAPHPLHVSTSDISYNASDGKLEVICTIFTDDFESALVKQYHTKTDLSRADMHAAMDNLVKNYVNSHVMIKANTSPISLNYLGFEIDREAVNVYMESNKIAPVKKAIADISLLHNLYDDQINIVHITVNGVRKSTKLEYPATRVVQEF